MTDPAPVPAPFDPARPGVPSVLRGAGIVLRPYEPADLPTFARWMRMPDLWAEQATAMPPADELTEAALAHLLNRRRLGEPGQLVWIIAQSADNQPVGQCSLSNFEPSAGLAEVGIEIPDAGERRRGVGRAAVELLVGFAFGALGLRRLTAWTHGANVASQRLFAAAGFRLARRCDEGLVRAGLPVQTWVYERTA